jgi:Salmonella virulence plasmid 65kDa B protein
VTELETTGQASDVDGPQRRHEPRSHERAAAAAPPADLDHRRSGTGTSAVSQAAGTAEKPGSPQTDNLARAADLLPSVSMPKEGGAIRGLNEKFAVNSATGAGSMPIRLPFSAGRSGFTAALQLSYDSASGNGPLGFGWSLGIPAITRKADKGLPQYCDGEEPDIFILAAAEDLVPTLDPAGGRRTVTRTVYGTPYQINLYRPRIEGLFSRIERWTATCTGLIHWRTISGDNVSALYGYDPGSTVADPADLTKDFAWQICRSWDDKGNLATYSYRAEDSNGVDRAVAHEANLTTATRATKIYLDSIRYGNIQPYRPNWTAEKEAPLPSDWVFSVVLDYGDHTSAPPTPQPDQPWPLRPDPFSTHRSRFEVRSYRRIQRILFFSNFPDERTAGQDCLTCSIDLVYSDQQNPPDPHGPIYTFLSSVTQTGYRQDSQGLVTQAKPLEFSYSEPVIGQEVQTLDPDRLGNMPEGLDDSRFRWVDLDGRACRNPGRCRRGLALHEELQR